MTPAQLKNRRRILKMTQAEIATALGVSERFWLYREQGKRPISQQLARAVRDLMRTRRKA